MRGLVFAVLLVPVVASAQPLDLVGYWVGRADSDSVHPAGRIGYAALTVEPDGVCRLALVVERGGRDYPAEIVVFDREAQCITDSEALQIGGYAITRRGAHLGLDAGEAGTLRFARAEAPPRASALLGRWRLRSTTHPDATGPPTLELADEFVRFGAAGTGTWVDGSRVERFTYLTVGPYVAVRSVGADPPAFALRTRFEVEGDRLTLTGLLRGERVRMVFERD